MDNSRKLAHILGWSGLLPLLLANIGVWQGYGVFAITLGNIYAAIILGFLGAIHWGLALDRENDELAGGLLLWSVIPALWGFFALWWSPILASLLLILGFIAQWLADQRLVRKLPSLPRWFFPLRTQLSAGIIVLLAIMALQVYLLTHP